VRLPPPADSRSARDPIYLVAALKLFHTVVLLAVAAGVHHLLAHDAAQTVRRWAVALRADPHDRWVEAVVGRVSGLSHARLEEISLGLVVYALLFAVEGVGLLARRRWAEWLTVVTTALLLPLELREVARRPDAARLVALAVNACVVVYLIARLRGRRKDESNRAATGPSAGAD
jgi:uncharacterized membrane protein (DUF2068 family)